ncbi:MAG: hypothetical protein OXD29_05595 [Roseovarius sp.]|nr:hypothetical protein [Roseovarius sp.]
MVIRNQPIDIGWFLGFQAVIELSSLWELSSLVVMPEAQKPFSGPGLLLSPRSRGSVIGPEAKAGSAPNWKARQEARESRADMFQRETRLILAAKRGGPKTGPAVPVVIIAVSRTSRGTLSHTGGRCVFCARSHPCVSV